MTGIFTLPAADVFAPTTAGGAPRGADMAEMQRWGEEVEDQIFGNGAVTPEQFGADPADETFAADQTALQAALDFIAERGYGTLVLQRLYSTTAPIIAKGAAGFLIIGATDAAGLKAQHTGDVLVVGAIGEDQTAGAFLENFIITQNAAGSTGASLRIYNAKNVFLSDVEMDGQHDAILAGDSDQPNDVLGLWIDGCRLAPAGGGGNALRLTSGSYGACTNTKFNGNGVSGVAGIVLGGSLENWDGFYFDHNTHEHWAIHVQSTGEGGGNISFDNSIMDRARERAFDIRPTGGPMQWLSIGPGMNIGDKATSNVDTSADTSIGLYFSNENGGAVSNIDIAGNLHDFGCEAIKFIGVSQFTIRANIGVAGRLTSNTYSSVKLTDCVNGSVSGCNITGTTHKYGIEATGTTVGVWQGNNNIVDAVTARVSGVPSGVTITDSTSSALAVGPDPANPCLQVDGSQTAAQTGIKVIGRAVGSTASIVVISPNGNEDLTIDAKGTGKIFLGAQSTGNIVSSRNVAPIADGTLTLGIAGTAWSGLYVKSGGTINYGNGNLIVTHSAGLLTIGGDLAWTGAGATAYTPTITANTGTFTSVSATGRYKRFGKYVLVQIVITITTNGTAASKIFATLPDTVSQEAIFLARNKTTGALIQSFASPAATQATVVTTANAYPGADATTLIVQGLFEVA